MSQILNQIEEFIFWADGDNFGKEETITILFEDGSTEVHVMNERPPFGKEISEYEYDKRANEQNRENEAAEVKRRERMLESLANRRKAVEKLTQLGLTEAEADSLGGA